MELFGIISRMLNSLLGAGIIKKWNKLAILNHSSAKLTRYQDFIEGSVQTAVANQQSIIQMKLSQTEYPSRIHGDVFYKIEF